MKMTMMILAALFTMSAQATELSTEAKQIIFDEIVMDVYFEDEGYARMPQSMNDFDFKMLDAKTIQVTGDSYSAWDDKVISYDCLVTVKAEKIQSAKDVVVKCTAENENWPNF